MSIPTITGKYQVGQTLTASIGDINPPVTYQWNRAGTPIPGAVNSTYTLLAADVGKTITLALSTISQPTAAVIDIIPANLMAPTISGVPQKGVALTGTFGTWSHSPTSFGYKWANAKGPIPGATQLTYVPTSADVGLVLQFFVVAINSGGSSAVAKSVPTAAVIDIIDIIPTNSVVPTISGTAQVGQTLTATSGTWVNNPTSFAYQWNRAGGAIPGATVSIYIPVMGDIGNTLTVSVVAKNSGGSSASATSAATAFVIAAAAVPAAFPGQPGNLVGHTAAPKYPGSLSPMSSSGPFNSGSPGSPQVYSYKDIDAGTGNVALNSSHHDIDFYGCRFQSNNTSYGNVIIDNSTNIRFFYCTICPRVALVGTTPPNAAWPSAGAGAGMVNQPNIYMIPASKGYAYGINLSTSGIGGPYTIEHCDIWGGTNHINLYGTTSQIILNNNWIHDHCDSTLGAHQDGIGYLNSGTGPSNVIMTNNTMASISNTNPAISFQGSTSGSNNITIVGNYIGGGGSYSNALNSTSNITFTDNIFGTDIPWQYGPLYANYIAKFRTSGNTWARNKLKVRAGTTPYPGSVLAWTSGQDGQFMYPDSTLHVADFT